MRKRQRGLGSLYRPRYRHKRTGEVRESEVWWFQLSVRGRVVRESTGETDHELALAKLEDRRRELRAGKPVTPGKLTFAGLERKIRRDYRRNENKSARRLESALKNLRERFDDYKAVEITKDEIEDYIEARERVAKPATIQKELAALRRMLNLAGLYEQAKAVPSLAPRNTRKGFFSDGDFAALCGQLSDEVTAPVRFLWLTGWRREEALGLRWSCVDFENGLVRAEPGETKSDEGKEFPFDVLPELETLLQARRETTTKLERETRRVIPWVFHRNGQRIVRFDKEWRDACKAIGKPGAWVHDLRRSAVRRFERAGIPRSIAMRLTGHLTESTYRRYAVSAANDLRDGVRKLAGLDGMETRKVVGIRETSKVSSKVRKRRRS